MANQKMLVALCLFGALALCGVSAQRFDYQACSGAVRYEADTYRKTLTEAAQRFSEALQQTGQQATDTTEFQKQMDKLTQSISSMADVSQGFDLTRFMSAYMENIQTISTMMRSSMRLSLFNGALREYIAFGQKIYSANTEFLERVSNQCMPSDRRIVLPANV